MVDEVTESSIAITIITKAVKQLLVGMLNDAFNQKEAVSNPVAPAFSTTITTARLAILFDDSIEDSLSFLLTRCLNSQNRTYSILFIVVEKTT